MEGKAVKVYFNLRKKCLSVMSNEGSDRGRVIAHVNEINLRDVTFKVSESGRKRVLETKQKNVHAFICGIVTLDQLSNVETPVTYNPYKYSSFVIKDSEAPIYKANQVEINGRLVRI